MARKTKQNPRASLNSDKDQDATCNLDTPIRPEVHLRRSSRNLPQTMQHGEDETRDIQGKILGSRADLDGTVDDEETGERKQNAKEGVKHAIEGLVRMERRLQRATKRQKIKLEETHLEVKADMTDSDGPDTAKDEAIKTVGPAPSAAGKEPKSKDGKLDRHRIGGHGMDPENGNIHAPEEDPDVPERGAARPPPVNSPYLPLPWKGRLGYACLNTYLRSAKPAVFSSRTCRMASIIDHRYPLTDPLQPEHPTKNRPDKSQDADHRLGTEFVQNLGLRNAADIIKMLRWNDKYGIKFMRLSSEMFPFASHEEHGYKLAPFASEVLGEVGRVAAELGHRLTTHPGQFTQLGSPRKEVIKASIRDLEYHDEMLTLLRLPEQQDRDAVMILHMGGVYGDKEATLDRFRQNYAKLSDSIKQRLVLENDDVAWSVHDLLPVCEELNIPLVLDYHHHNIIFDSTKCREGTFDISQPEIMERIAATWRRKGIKQKMHYSEPCPDAITPRDRRKHSPRVKTLPPCPPDMDLMIEAKDKEQAVFELMRTFKLPGFEKINDVIPHDRPDEARPPPKEPKKKAKTGGNQKRKRAPDEKPIELNDVGVGADDQVDMPPPGGREVTYAEFGMGGPDNRVYWPPGMEDWLKPKKRQQKNGRSGREIIEEEMEEEGLAEEEGI
ncbi:UV-endonuclease UvdE-domain-containing protein [Podospora australis]|uniref:UV-endonuclease UvdE-domain-containing protein n=1 Tax=Podospora australis TaxID=1536484 RepID=A0AAN6WR29_9PEZI|nr:UV-endonuclease UvdE-domain-containing protein [Podospora australis]